MQFDLSGLRVRVNVWLENVIKNRGLNSLSFSHAPTDQTVRSMSQAKEIERVRKRTHKCLLRNVSTIYCFIYPKIFGLQMYTHTHTMQSTHFYAVNTEQEWFDWCMCMQYQSILQNRNTIRKI